MQIDSLYLRGFRNYRETRADFVPGVNLIVGSNANGKTNLLEAISYLSLGHAFRTRREQELIRFGEDFGEISACVTGRDRQQELRAVLFPGKRPRQLWLNGVRQKTAAGMVGVLPTVLFCPEDLLVLKKGAAPRRKLLDAMISQLRPNYQRALAEYTRLLEQKSNILRTWRQWPSMLEVLPEYNCRMAQVGAILISYRARFLEALGREAAVYHRDFSGEREELVLNYKTVSSVTDPFAPTDTLRENLEAHMASHEQGEKESGQCLSGPHRDDFETLLNGLPTAQFASQGQTRTAVISIKLAEAAIMRRELEEEPVLLLDDVLSELDKGRQDFVLNELRSGQVFITCCETDRYTQLGRVFSVDNGTLSPGENGPCI